MGWRLPEGGFGVHRSLQGIRVQQLAGEHGVHQIQSDLLADSISDLLDSEMKRASGLMACLLWIVPLSMHAENPPANRPVPPVWDPFTPGYVQATELPDGQLPAKDEAGNFILGPTHPPAPELGSSNGILHGRIVEFTVQSTNSAYYPGIARDQGTFGIPDTSDPSKLVVTTSHAAPYSRKVGVYIPGRYPSGTPAPFIVGADGIDRSLFTALDRLIDEKRIPVMIGISIGNGGGDAQGSERGLEYDTMSGRYAEFVEKEILPLVESNAAVTLTKDPSARATMGTSSGGACALSMAWYHPDLYRRVLSYSGTFVNQQWPHDPATPHGAWEYHEHVIPESPSRPLRLWLEVGDHDLLNPNIMRDGMHDWVECNERMAKVLASKGYPYQFLFARNAKHGDKAVKLQTLPEALEWLWADFGKN